MQIPSTVSLSPNDFDAAVSWLVTRFFTIATVDYVLNHRDRLLVLPDLFPCCPCACLCPCVCCRFSFPSSFPALIHRCFVPFGATPKSICWIREFEVFFTAEGWAPAAATRTRLCGMGEEHVQRKGRSLTRHSVTLVHKYGLIETKTFTTIHSASLRCRRWYRGRRRYPFIAQGCSQLHYLPILPRAPALAWNLQPTTIFMTLASVLMLVALDQKSTDELCRILNTVRTTERSANNKGNK